nr:MAG TPA: hypothetical protein [Microviridae sp.]
MLVFNRLSVFTLFMINLYVKLNYLCMFRNHLPKFVPSPSNEIFEVQKSQVNCEDGKIVVQSKIVNVADDSLPTIDEYNLKTLLASGVPLSVLPADVLTTSETKANDVINEIVQSDKNVDENV